MIRLDIDTIFIFFLASSILVSIVGIGFSEEIFRLMALPEEILPLAVTYLNIYISGMFFFFGFAGIPDKQVHFAWPVIGGIHGHNNSI